MNIRGSQIGPNHSEGLRNGYVQNAGRINGHEVSSVQAIRPTASQGDRVEISDAARTAANDTQARELTFARKALDGLPELGPERIAEIRSRIEDGYYSNPDVIRQVAANVAGELTGGSSF